MPLLDERAKLVAGDVKAVEVGVAVVALHLLTLNSNLPPGGFVRFLVEVTEGDLENATTERIGGDFYVQQHTWVSKRANLVNSPGNEQPPFSTDRSLTLSGSFIARGQSRGRDVEVGGDFHVVPLLLDERMSAK